jgi:L-gulonolactone oxidase
MSDVSKEKQSGNWKSYTETLSVDNVTVLEVSTEEEIQNMVLYANENNLKIRASAGWDMYEPETNDCKSCLFKCGSCFGIEEAVEERYNESFSWTPFVCGTTDIILRFSEKFHNVTINTAAKTATVTAGTQIGQVVDKLWDTGYSLSTASMIPYVSAVGLAATGGHGTGLREGSFAGLIRKMRICNHKGEIVEIDSTSPHFENIRGAHMGLFGIVVSIDLELSDRFWLKEIRTPMNSLSEVSDAVSNIVPSNDYTTLVCIPVYDTEKGICKFEYRTWKKLYSRPKKCRTPPLCTMDFFQHLKVQTGEDVLTILNSGGCTKLTRFVLGIAGHIEIGNKPQVYTHEDRVIAHSQISYPKHMVDLSVLFPVSLTNFDTFNQHLEWMDKTLTEFNNNDRLPVTLAMYIRFFKGTNGGLSTSPTESDDEITVALEVATGDTNEHWNEFRSQMISHFMNTEPRVKFHLGKFIPSILNEHYTTAEFSTFLSTLHEWYGSEALFRGSCFATDYIQRMIYGGGQSLCQNLQNCQKPKTKIRGQRILHFQRVVDREYRKQLSRVIF